MWIIIFIIIAVVGFYMWTIHRGKKAVRAYAFVAMVDEGASVAEANEFASRLDTQGAAQLNHHMLTYCNIYYGGKQLPLISDARMKGFRY